MAHSDITKKALASAVKDLMTIETFNKISVSDICNRCGMSRKSFYYHFKDKYDLINWIYAREISDHLIIGSYENILENIETILYNIDKRKDFYTDIINYEGQNSFYEFFIGSVNELFKSTLYFSRKNKRESDIMADFCSRAIVASVKLWLNDYHDLSSQEYLKNIRKAVLELVPYICEG